MRISIGYQNTDDFVRNGNDAMLGFTQHESNAITNKGSVTLVSDMRQACKNNEYGLLLSRRPGLNKICEGERKDEISETDFKNDIGRKMLSLFRKRFLAVQKCRKARYSKYGYG